MPTRRDRVAFLPGPVGGARSPHPCPADGRRETGMIDRVRPYAVRDGRRFAREVGTAGAPEPPLTRPVPGRFYAIQAGHGGLLQTATRAYGVPLQPNPIRLAQLINN